MNPNEIHVTPIARQIEAVIEAIKVEGKRSIGLVEKEAEAIWEYKKAIAGQILRRKAEGLPVTLIKGVVDGDVADEERRKNLAVGGLKAHWERLRLLQGQQNGFQSMFRHLESTSK